MDGLDRVATTSVLLLRGNCFLFMGDSHVLSQTVLVFKLLLTVFALSRWLRRVLCSNVPPEINGGDDQFAKLALRPFIG